MLRTILTLAIECIGNPHLADLIAEEVDAQLLILDAEHRIMHANDDAAAACGERAERLLSRPVDRLHENLVADERRAIREHVFMTAEPLAVFGMLRGIFTKTLYIPFDYERADLNHPFLPSADHAGRGRAMLCLVRRVTEFRRPDGAEQIRRIRARRHEMGALVELSARELEVLHLTAQGHRAEDIAHQIHRTRRTVESHRLRIARKLGAKNTVQLARAAVEAGLTALRLDELEGLLGGEEAWTAEELAKVERSGHG